MSKEITTLDDVKLLVDTFYTKVRQDDLLKDVFNNRIEEDKWPFHLDKMYTFWQTILLGEHTYYGSPFAPHVGLPVQAEHFGRWLQLFSESIDELFVGIKATEAKLRATKMAEMFQYKLATKYKVV